MAKDKSATRPTVNGGNTELDDLKTRHDAVHHAPPTTGNGGLAARGKTLEDEWIYREEKRKAEEAKQKGKKT